MKMYGEDKLVPKKRPKKKKAKSGKKVLVIVLLIILALACVAGALWYTNVQAPEIISPGKPVDTPANSEDAGKIKIRDAERKEDLYNILIVGTDLNGYHTDSMMLASFDAKNKKMNILSIPRDLICHGGGDYYYKINSAYRGSEEKIDDLYDEIERAIGFRPDKYVIVSTQGFVEMIDEIGGVEVDVQRRMKYTDPTQDLYIDIQPGLQVLDGYDSMCFMRYRYGYVEGDVGRVRAQHQFVNALMDKMLTAETLAKLPELVDIVEENVKTDLTVGNMIWLGTKVLDMNLETDLNTYILPGEGLYYNKVSYFFVYPNQMKTLINEVFNPYTSPIEDFDIVNYTRLTGKAFGGE